MYTFSIFKDCEFYGPQNTKWDLEKRILFAQLISKNL